MICGKSYNVTFFALARFRNLNNYLLIRFQETNPDVRQKKNNEASLINFNDHIPPLFLADIFAQQFTFGCCNNKANEHNAFVCHITWFWYTTKWSSILTEWRNWNGDDASSTVEMMIITSVEMDREEDRMSARRTYYHPFFPSAMIKSSAFSFNVSGIIRDERCSAT